MRDIEYDCSGHEFEKEFFHNDATADLLNNYNINKSYNAFDSKLSRQLSTVYDIIVRNGGVEIRWKRGQNRIQIE